MLQCDATEKCTLHNPINELRATNSTMWICAIIKMKVPTVVYPCTLQYILRKLYVALSLHNYCTLHSVNCTQQSNKPCTFNMHIELHSKKSHRLHYNKLCISKRNACCTLHCAIFQYTLDYISICPGLYFNTLHTGLHLCT